MRLGDGLRPAVRFAEQSDGSIEVADGEYYVFDAIDRGSGDAGRGLDAPGARGLVFNDEGECGAWGSRARVRFHPFDGHTIRTLATAAFGSGDGDAGFFQAIHFEEQDVSANRPGAGDGIFGHKPGPVGTGGDAWFDGSDEFEVSAVVKANHGHLGNAVAVRTSEVGSEADVGKLLAERIEIRSADRGVIELEDGGFVFGRRLSGGRLGHGSWGNK